MPVGRGAAAIRAKIWRRRSGASPSEGSSSSSSRGRAISAARRSRASAAGRPTASSPARRDAGARSGKMSNIAATAAFIAARPGCLRLDAPEHEVLCAPSGRGRCGGPRACARCRRARCPRHDARWIGRPRSRISPPAARSRPETVRSTVRLARAVGAQQRDDLALVDVQRDLPQRLHAAVEGRRRRAAQAAGATCGSPR